MTPPEKPRPFFQSAVAAFHAISAGVFIWAGLSGASMHVPPVGLAMMGAVWIFPAAMSAWLAYWHFRLKRALRELESHGGRP